MKIQPFFDKLFITPMEAVEKTPSGIIIPDTAKEKSKYGIINFIGTDEGMEIFKEGDHILFGKYAGEETTVDGVDYTIICRNDVLAILR